MGLIIGLGNTKRSVTSPTPVSPTGYVKDGLVLHYSALNNTGAGHDNNTNVWKDLIGNNDGDIVNAQWKDSSLSFNGTNALVKFKGDITPSFTIHAFVKRDAAQGQHARIWAEEPYPSLYLHTQGLRYALYGQGVDLPFAPDKTMPADEWIVLSVSYEVGSNSVLLYENGLHIGRLAVTRNPQSTVSAFLGGRGSGAARFFKGEYRTFLIYNRALTTEEIQTNFEADTKTQFP